MKGVDHVNRAYTFYSRIAAVIFIVNTLYPLMVKLAQQRLGHDWFHSLLHLICALLGAYVGWRVKGVIAPKVFTLSVGTLYVGLAVYGGFMPGLFLGSPLAIPLGVADNIFHLLLSLPALTILVLDLARLQRLNAS